MSIELFVGFLKPNFFEVKVLSILYEVPDKAAAPRGDSLINLNYYKNLILSLLNIS